MSADNPNRNDWQTALDHKARLLYAQIAQLQREVAEYGGDDQLLDEMTQPYIELLKSLYAEDYPLAKAIAQSDLLVRLDGPAISRDNPRVSLIGSVFDNVRTQVGKVAKAIAQLSQKGIRGIPKEMDLGLSAYAKGSLILGFTVPTASEIAESQQGQETLFGEQDPFFQAARDAIRTIGIVTKHVTEGGTVEELAAEIPDPEIRDTALAAVKELAPSGRLGIKKVRLAGRGVAGLNLEKPLTPLIREAIRKSVQHPVATQAEAPVTIVGDVREIDLDERRFELRHIENLEENVVRCAYLEQTDEEARQWLNRRVRVEGIPERNAANKVRLLEVTSIEIVD